MQPYAQPLSGKTVVITGASAGIGRACAELFWAQGASLALGARRADRLQSLVEGLKPVAPGQSAVAFTLDVTVRASVEKFVEATVKRFGKIDVLINNAGLALGTAKLVDAREEDWRAMFDTNVLGLMRTAQLVVGQMLHQPTGGDVINISSIAGHVTYEGGSAYCASKHAVVAINDTLRIEVLGKPIRVGSIDPGMVDTEFSAVRFQGDAAKAKQVYAGMTPLTARDIAETALFMATRPRHVNIDRVMINPTDQAGLKVHRV